MPTTPTKLHWYLNRLRSMPPAELPHRARELVKKRLDRHGVAARLAARLPEAALTAPLPALPVDRAFLRESLAGERERLRRLTDELLRGELTLLGQRWPAGSRRDWQLDPESGERWPADRGCHDIPYRQEAGPGDVKFVWELNRLQHLVVLALGALALDEPRAEAAVWGDLEAWIDENPPYRGVSWACGIELASRVASVLAILGILGPERAPASLRPKLQRSLYAHGLFMARYPSRFSSANNHLIAEAAALLLLGLLAPHLPGAAHWEAEGREELEREVQLQIFADGVGGEQAPTYTAYTLEWYALARQVARAAGKPLSDAVDRRLGLALLHLHAIMDRAGNVPHLGDDDGAVVLRASWDREDDVRSVMGALSGLLERPELAPPGARQDALAGLLGARVPTTGWSAPPGRSFAEGGVTALRHTEGERELLAVLDHGPLGYGPIAAHGHADALSLCVHVDGVPLLVDPGAYRYNHSGGWREHLRSTRAHNTIEVSALSQSVPTGAFNWGARAEARRESLSIGPSQSRVAATHDGYRERLGVLHRRVVSLDGVDTLRVDDELLGTGARPVAVTWQIGPDWVLEPTGGAWVARGPRGLQVRISVEGVSLSGSLIRGGEAPGVGAISPFYNRLVPAPCLWLEGEARLPAKWSWTFVILR